MSDRKAQLEGMLKDDPGDTFLRYALAMEHRKLGDADQSLEILTGLMDDKPAHVPSFLMAAQQLVEQSEIERARTVLRTGIETARDQGESHAAAELGELLANIGELGE